MNEEQATTSNTGKRTWLRRVLMLGGAGVVAIAGAWFYSTSGRYIATDNAYIKAAKILVTPQVAGAIVSVAVTDNQQVHAGDLLFTIDPDNFQIAVDMAKAELADVGIEIARLKAEYRQKLQELEKAGVDVDFTTQEYDRRVPLVNSGITPKAEFNETRRQRDAAAKEVDSLREEANGLRAALANDPDIAPEQHPLYQKAHAALRKAELELERTQVFAPIDGIIGTVPHIGDYARAGVPTLDLVGSGEQWIEANFKETELTDVKVGQLVTIEIDTYPGHEWHGRVESISPATGSEFSVLPAQNATGNWVKVVQRIGVRIAIEPQANQLPLRTGMSTQVSIDTGRYPHALLPTAVAAE
jgi:membrane fusion protein (multidrug efflux system)